MGGGAIGKHYAVDRGQIADDRFLPGVLAQASGSSRDSALRVKFDPLRVACHSDTIQLAKSGVSHRCRRSLIASSTMPAVVVQLDGCVGERNAALE